VDLHDPSPNSFWAVSDLHLHPSRPDVVEHFRRFLQLAAERTSTLVILGDLFDYWIGPYAFHRDEFSPVFHTLRDVLQDGLDLHFVGGNRDFLAGNDLGRLLNVSVHRSRWTRRRNREHWLGLHGDTLCHRDTSYQVYRRLIQNDFVGDAVRALPGPLKSLLIRRLRETSRKKVSSMQSGGPRLSPGRVRAHFRQGYNHLICGHVHDPGGHTVEIGDRTCHLWVLGDWFEPEECVFFIGQPDQSRLAKF